MSIKIRLVKFSQSPRQDNEAVLSLRYYEGIIFGYESGVMWCVMTLHVLPFF